MRVSLSGNEDYGLKMLLASIEEKREVFEKVHPCRGRFLPFLPTSIFDLCQSAAFAIVERV